MAIELDSTPTDNAIGGLVSEFKYSCHPGSHDPPRCLSPDPIEFRRIDWRQPRNPALQRHRHANVHSAS